MSDWSLILYCGFVTFLTRFSMIALLKKEMFNDRIREVLSFVPSAIFPAIIFPAIFLDSSGDFQLENTNVKARERQTISNKNRLINDIDEWNRGRGRERC